MLEGPNGSGKSTLLRIMAGVSIPSAGRVAGRPHTGYVPERFPPALAFSAREYLQHMGRIHGLSPAAAPARPSMNGSSGSARRTMRGRRCGRCLRGCARKLPSPRPCCARPGLLVLDEAWTGLDQAARGALDAAVAERLAGGATVLFVDHDQARLADRVDERWQLAAGRVVVVPSEAQERSPAGPGRTEAGASPAPQTATIEVTGLEAASLDRLTGLAGVLAVAAESAGVGEAAVAAEAPGYAARPLAAVRVTVSAAMSDAVLRELLSWDGVHVSAVGPGRVQPGPEQSGRGRPRPGEVSGGAEATP